MSPGSFVTLIPYRAHTFFVLADWTRHEIEVRDRRQIVNLDEVTHVGEGLMQRVGRDDHDIEGARRRQLGANLAELSRQQRTVGATDRIEEGQEDVAPLVLAKSIGPIALVGQGEDRRLRVRPAPPDRSGRRRVSALRPRRTRCPSTRPKRGSSPRRRRPRPPRCSSETPRAGDGRVAALSAARVARSRP